MRDNDYKFFTLILIGLLLLQLADVFILFKENVTCSEVTTGTVQEISTEYYDKYSMSHNRVLKPVVEYTINGKTYTSKPLIANNEAIRKAGTEVEVKVDPKDIHHIYLAEPDFVSIIRFVLIAITFTIWLGGTYLAIKHDSKLHT